MTITPIYAGLLALIYLALSIQVIRSRWNTRVSLGDGGDPTLLHRLRAHGNFAEYVPFVLVLMMLLESQQASATLLHTIGGALTIGRLSHAYGVSHKDQPLIYRSIGIILTFVALATGAISTLMLAMH